MERQRNPQEKKHRRDTEGDTSWEGEQERRKRERERVSAEVGSVLVQ